MSDAIKHECGLAYIRLKKPLSFYLEKYGTVSYGLNKLYLLMEKQHNRGQDGAGVATVKLEVENGYEFLHRVRSNARQPISDIFSQIGDQIGDLEKYLPEIQSQPEIMKGHVPMLGELLLGHLRYGTQGKNDVEFCHPFIKRSLNKATNMAMAGNFNLVNTKELFEFIGMQPGNFQKQSDLAAMMEVVHHFLVKEAEETNNNIDVAHILRQATSLFDGGYTVSGLIGNGKSFVMRDEHGIRPAYYYADDEVVVAASERASIRTTFNVGENAVKELMPGMALIVDEKGNHQIEKILEPKERRACSFERIYFSRGGDEKIYRERIALGYHLSKRILDLIDADLKNTIFSYIPNTAEVAFYGLVKGMEDYLNTIKVQRIMSWNGDFDQAKLEEMVNRKIRQEKIAIKDVKMRTFITADAGRNEMVQHVYDITYGTVKRNQDTLVVIDDSIVRGTTLKESIVRMLSRLEPKKIIVVSSAPQIRYPDCYGIDMSRMGDFVAFRAALALHKDRGTEHVLQDVLNKCLELQKTGQMHTQNAVKGIYADFTPEEISEKIAELITPEDVNVPVEVIYQTIEDLHDSCPTNTGDWYFTGNYPTPGGNRVVNKAFLNYMEGVNTRGY
ncbi:amidophosphoribosyltransferase [Arachidicoccus ginsenosidivorans]|jgi:amidophosphoribosyltransferase|uniref:Amidophosphoribosyltransferase n=1 Tax=Arachidicoccus ginsenosidivorans TaxID=496057 RepID=A0A5B8VLH8_9BACT|nr:amidophosphoribosyltransferase [Arachidicoccus ginsenosidivorans]QEC71815.1 amidophosphoribosyltransferase [Arachidicoccus ginsenosidivorans]